MVELGKKENMTSAGNNAKNNQQIRFVALKYSPARLPLTRDR